MVCVWWRKRRGSGRGRERRRGEEGGRERGRRERRSRRWRKEGRKRTSPLVPQNGKKILGLNPV